MIIMPLMQRTVPVPSLAATTLAIAGVALASNMILRRSPSPPRRRGFAAPTWCDAPLVEQSTVTAARRLNRAAGTLAASVFADSCRALSRIVQKQSDGHAAHRLGAFHREQRPRHS